MSGSGALSDGLRRRLGRRLGLLGLVAAILCTTSEGAVLLGYLATRGSQDRPLRRGDYLAVGGVASGLAAVLLVAAVVLFLVRAPAPAALLAGLAAGADGLLAWAAQGRSAVALDVGQGPAFLVGAAAVAVTGAPLLAGVAAHLTVAVWGEVRGSSSPGPR